MLASIIDLPTELIVEIIHSDNSTDATSRVCSMHDVACLGMTCRRLHDICQVFVLERQLPVLRALVGRRHLLIYKDPTSSIALKDEELDDVNAVFQGSFHRIYYLPIAYVAEEIASVHGLIFHANAVGHITLNFSRDVLNLQPFSAAEKGYWYKPLASFIRISWEKVARLTISGIPQSAFKFTHIPKTQKTEISIFGRCEDCFFSGGTCASERERLLNTGVDFGTRRGLKSFEIHSPLPFHKACFPHTLQALHGGHLTKLSFQGILILNWGNILPLLFMPFLSEFNVQDSDIAFNHLSPFLQRHSSITHLDLSCAIPVGPIMPPKGFLPHLKVISGNPNYLSQLLSRQRHSKFKFPHLRSIALKPYHPRLAIKRRAFDNIIRNLANHKRATIHLSLQFSQRDIDEVMEWFMKAEANSKPGSLDCVKTLEIRFGYLISSKVCDRFFSWVSAFPYLQELDLKRAVPSTLKNMSTWGLDELWDSCPELRSVIVQGKTYQRPAKLEAVQSYSS